MLVTPGCDPGIYGPDKDGVDWDFGSFTEAAVNDFQEKILPNPLYEFILC